MARDAKGRWVKGSNGAMEGHPRGRSLLPKEPRSLLKAVWEDSKTREALLVNLREMAKSPKACMAFLTISADYLEGRPKQSVEVTAKRTTNFLEAATPAALTPPPEEPV